MFFTFKQVVNILEFANSYIPTKIINVYIVCVRACVCVCVCACVLILALNTVFITKNFQFYYQITALMTLNKISFTTNNMQKDELHKLSSCNTYNCYTLKLGVL